MGERRRQRRHRLHVDLIDTVGIVDKGDDPESQIVFLKRAGGVMEKPDPTMFRKMVEAIGSAFGLGADDVNRALKDGDDPPPDPKEGGKEDGVVKEFKLEELPEVAQEEFRKLQGEAQKVAGLEEQVQKLTDQVAELTPKEDPEPDPEPIPEELQKKLDDAEKRATEAEERIAKLEAEKRNTIFVKQAGELTALPGFKPDDHATLLDKIEAAIGAESYEAFIGILKSAAQAVRTGELFKTAGRGGISTSIETEVQEAADELRKTNPDWTVEKARAEVWKRNPELYVRYEAERATRAAEGQ